MASFAQLISDLNGGFYQAKSENFSLEFLRAIEKIVSDR